MASAPGLMRKSVHIKYARRRLIMGSRPMRILLYPLLALGLFGADWPQLRGPNGSGLCPYRGQLSTELGLQNNVLGKTRPALRQVLPRPIGGPHFSDRRRGR